MTSTNHSRKEFFLRARVVSDDETISGGGKRESLIRKRSERRILVRYSKGSTYRVRAYNLIPILEPSVHNADESPPASQEEEGALQQTQAATPLPPLVVLVPETNIYRRVARVHAAPGDSFVEIGCDYGVTVDKIRRSLEEAGDVPKDWPADGKDRGDGAGERREAQPESDERVPCLGVDRSKESIDIANERYPECKFALANVLAPEEMSSVRALCERSLAGSSPSVLCIDVNGNREISGVLECLKVAMNEPWKRRPRMIIVKSRFLYWELKRMETDDANGSA